MYEKTGRARERLRPGQKQQPHLLVAVTSEDVGVSRRNSAAAPGTLVLVLNNGLYDEDPPVGLKCEWLMHSGTGNSTLSYYSHSKNCDS